MSNLTAKQFDRFISSGNGTVSIAVSLENRLIFSETLLVDVLCDGSFADLYRTIRKEIGAAWAIADSWEIRHESAVEYVPLAA